MRALKKKGPFYVGVLTKEPLYVLPKNVVPLFPQKMVKCAPQRNFECANYNSCLDLAANLNWKSFTCQGCCGEPNLNLTQQPVLPGQIRQNSAKSR